MNMPSEHPSQADAPKAIIVGGFASLTLSDHELAAAAVAGLVLKKCQFEFTTTGDAHTIRVSAEKVELLEDIVRPHFAYIQQGGSSSELYLCCTSSPAEVEAARYDCWENGGYKTSALIEIPPVLAALGDAAYPVIDTILGASTSLEKAERPEVEFEEEEDEEPDTPAPSAASRPRM